jgi:hypothetical protein
MHIINKLFKDLEYMKKGYTLGDNKKLSIHMMKGNTRHKPITNRCKAKFAEEDGKFFFLTTSLLDGFRQSHVIPHMRYANLNNNTILINTEERLNKHKIRNISKSSDHCTTNLLFL